LSTVDCQCQVGAYKSSSEADKRAISLVSGRAQLSTLANHNLVLYKPTAVFNSTAGPPGSKGAVTFDRAFSQHLDTGAHTFNIATNGGFTAVALAKFTGVLSAWERIIDFGNGPESDNILLWRQESSRTMSFGIMNGNTVDMCRVNMTSIIVQNSWMTIVGTYVSNKRRLLFET